MHVVGFFEVNQFIDVVLLSESRDQFVLVFVKTPRKVVSDTDVQDSVVPVG
jgi:hypothetical protein